MSHRGWGVSETAPQSSVLTHLLITPLNTITLHVKSLNRPAGEEWDCIDWISLRQSWNPFFCTYIWFIVTEWIKLASVIWFLKSVTQAQQSKWQRPSFFLSFWAAQNLTHSLHRKLQLLLSMSFSKLLRGEHWLVLNVLLLKYMLKIHMPFLLFSFLTNYCLSSS